MFKERDERMKFWELQPTGQIAIIEQNGHTHTYDDLQKQINYFTNEIASNDKRLGLILCQNRLQDIVAYLGALQSGDAVMLLDEKVHKPLIDTIVTTYKPDWIHADIQGVHADYEQIKQNLFIRKENEGLSIYPELAVLLSTSGTTGSVKFVRLSYSNLEANAASIATYLQLNQTERPLLSLPMQYSYGLSVINSHLKVRATMLINNESVISKEFWQRFNQYEATSFAGVPYTYQMLHRLRFNQIELPTLRSFTQAGGRLSAKLINYFQESAKQKDARFYVMYGQTEATARMSYMPPEYLQNHIGSIGISIPDGEFSIDENSKELIYKGPNVMLGYAFSRMDLEKGDECNGVLFTGDLAEVTNEGFYSIIGRKNRFVKLFGLRISLDDVEKTIEQKFQLVVACTGTDERMVIAIEEGHYLDKVKRFVGDVYGLHHSSYSVIIVEAIPRLANGKVDYKQLMG
ncbi:long-chain-fatty-acid-CoA ligase [Halalkalibacter hemicellulosilyticusJCM 9152]|uniref:Long-chain-fatty-acid-CoA ligase n=2 Tax=Halalkalibacter TaxID=2893056 RepID=W4QLB5_9BACI|nr:long-chain-fatty-acid-CoA ligase [Halalkalibacter hemicellulosilyticusJCM 9152]